MFDLEAAFEIIVVLGHAWLPTDGIWPAASSRLLNWNNVRDPLYFLGRGIPYIYVKKDPVFFLG